MLNRDNVKAVADALQQNLQGPLWDGNKSPEQAFAEVARSSLPRKEAQQQVSYETTRPTKTREKAEKPAKHRSKIQTRTEKAPLSSGKFEYTVRCSESIATKLAALAAAIGADPTTTFRVAVVEMWERKIDSGLLKN